jgi:hypothetical protein
VAFLQLQRRAIASKKCVDWCGHSAVGPFALWAKRNRPEGRLKAFAFANGWRL